MSSSARAHFKLAGTPIRVEPFFWIVAVLFGLNLFTGWYVVVWVGVVFLSVLTHEMGHALAYLAFGQRAAVVLHGFGGLTFGQRKLPRGQSIIVSLAGPLTSLLLIGLPARYFFERGHGVCYVGGPFCWRLVLYMLVFANVWWSLANLLPIRPLDGGHVVEEIFGLDNARIISVVAAVAGGIWAYGQGYTYPALYAALLGFTNFSEYRRARQGQRGPSAFDVDHPEPIGGMPRRASHLHAVSSAPVMPAAGNPAEADQLERRGWNALRNGSISEAQRAVAVGGDRLSAYLRGTVALAAGDDDGLTVLASAYRTSQPPNLVTATVLAATGQSLPLAQRILTATDGRAGVATLQTNLHYAERFREAAVVGEALAHAGSASPAQTAFEVACSWSRAGEGDRAIEWLDRAADAGFRAPALVDGEPDLELVRRDPRWPVLRARLS